MGDVSLKIQQVKSKLILVGKRRLRNIRISRKGKEFTLMLKLPAGATGKFVKGRQVGRNTRQVYNRAV